MDEEEFLSQPRFRAWRDGDLGEAQNALVLSSKLWGDPENLRCQLLASSPKIPAGLNLPGLRYLLTLAYLGLRFADKPIIVLGGTPVGTGIAVGGKQFSVHEARYEVVRRAILALGGG